MPRSAPLRILVVGSGAREDALAHRLSICPSVASVLVAPGNAGTHRHRATTPVAVASDDVAGLVELASREAVDLVVVGPEAPLCAGLVDALAERGISAFGPTAAAAQLEASKAFCKRFARDNDIPTAPFEVFTELAAAEAYIRSRSVLQVVKADGICAGKGVVVAHSADEACEAARAALEEGAFGDAGRTIVVEDRIDGREVSLHAICDGERAWLMPPARDHKRIGDGDVGPNTGGMGAFAATSIVDPKLLVRIEAQILGPTVRAMAAAGRPFRGALFAGLMITPAGDPMLLEYNVRFGDPETEVMLPLIDGDFAALLHSAATGALDPSSARIAPDRAAVAVVLASAGYPGKVRAGVPIHGIEQAERAVGITVYHAGTKTEGDATLSSGGRVLTVSAVGSSLLEARDRAYAAARAIRFEGMQMRSDIAGAAPAA